MTSCLQYYYENPEDAEKYKINCEGKVFPPLKDVDTFTNSNLLNFINSQYSETAFPDNSPFEFSPGYINLSNAEICKSVEMSLAPQQKFMGQLMGPATNFNNILVFHGLGSGKSCTSIVIGEALKNATNQRLLYAVPAPLIEQYYEEIIGEIRNGKFFSCPSFCLVLKDGNRERDFYVSQPKNALLQGKLRNLETEINKIYEIEKEIDTLGTNPDRAKRFKDQENKVAILKSNLKTYQQQLRGNIIRTFELVSHQTFIESIYKTGKDGQLIKNRMLLGDSALFHKNGLLVIDEIQRLVSAGGIFYKKLYNAIKYYFHPELRIALLSATPIYDNPYELALTINLLRPRVPFPIEKSEFYKFFIGKYDESGNCVESANDWISDDSCIINKDLISYICSGYVSYFKGGNPNAYPYKRIITLEHVFSETHKAEYISALRSDVSKDKIITKKTDKTFNSYESVLLGDYSSSSEDKVSGMYVTTQQYSNIFLPKSGSEINKTLDDKKRGLELFKSDLNSMKGKSIQEIVNFVKMYSTKFASIIELSLASDGPVFIFSNWLTFGVEPLALILQTCGLVSFEKEDRGMGKFFIWSSDTKTKDKDGTLIKKARNTFNSTENSGGKLLKIILGTRSVMEGVSFKNVKQVHITEPWWNESRIEQILARASRFCSHSNLPIDQQYVDIYRHYSTLPEANDKDVMEMFKDIDIPFNFRELATFGIDQKMLISSIKKQSINLDLEIIVKNSAIDCEINKNGNIIRLEEYNVPTGGKYQIYYKNPTNGKIYIREGIPHGIDFKDIYSRVYTYPNKDLPVKFIEAVQGEDGIFQPYPDPDILEEPVINADLNMKEQLEPWKSNDTLSTIKIDETLRSSIKKLYQNYNLIPLLRRSYFKESGTDVITFKDDIQVRLNLIRCIKELSKQNLVSATVKKDIAQEFSKDTQKQKANQKVLDLIYKYNVYPESYLDDLLQIAIERPEVINETLKQLSK